MDGKRGWETGIIHVRGGKFRGGRKVRARSEILKVAGTRSRRNMKKKQFATFSNIFARKKAQRPMTH